MNNKKYNLDTIYNVNCFDFFKQLDDKSIDCIFTSPPYNRKRNDKYRYYNDIILDYDDFLRELFAESLRLVKHLSFINLQCTYYNSHDVYKVIGEYSDKIKNIIIWEKTNPMPASGHNVTNGYEIFVVLGGADERFQSNNTYTKNIFATSVNSHMPKNHHAVMHPDAARYVINNFTKKDWLIFDPFMGTGTTARICKETGRHYIGCEIVPEYCDESEKNLYKS